MPKYPELSPARPKKGLRGDERIQKWPGAASRRLVVIEAGRGKNLVELGPKVEQLESSQMRPGRRATSQKDGNNEFLRTLVTGASGQK